MIKGIACKTLALSILGLASMSAYAQKYHCTGDHCVPVCYGETCGMECSNVVCTPE